MNTIRCGALSCLFAATILGACGGDPEPQDKPPITLIEEDSGGEGPRPVEAAEEPSKGAREGGGFGVEGEA